MKPEVLVPKPGSLKPDAACEWHRVAPYLAALGRVTEIDYQSLQVYVKSWAGFVHIMRDELADRHIELHVAGPKCQVIHPLLQPLLSYAETTFKIACQFGMSARTRDLGSDHANRKASALKKLMGNQRKVANRNLEDKVIPMLPRWNDGDMHAPRWMNDVAKAEYDRLGDKLGNLDLFTPLDYTPLSICCTLYELHDRAISQAEELYTSVYNKDGDEIEIRAHPIHKVANELHKALQVIWKDYGQTPRYRKIFDEGETQEEKRETPLIFKGAGA